MPASNSLEVDGVNVNVAASKVMKAGRALPLVYIDVYVNVNDYVHRYV
jgi:hypothetical protein